MEIRSFPEDRRIYLKQINKDDLYKMPYSGLFEKKMDKDPERSYLAYIPENSHLSSPAVILISEEKQDRLEFLEHSGWIKTADKNDFIVIVPDPDLPEDLFPELVIDFRKRDNMVINKAYIYICGYGSGAEKAQRMAMRSPTSFAGLVLYGAPNITGNELAAMDAVPTYEADVPASRVPLPLWLVCDADEPSAKRVLEYWKRADHCKEEPFERNGDLWYLPEDDSFDINFEREVGAKIRVSGKRFPTSDELWDQLKRYARFVGIGNGSLTIIPPFEKSGLVFRTIVVDGVRREWLLYTPEKVSRSGRKVPLVFSFHGASNRHIRHAHLTQWIKIAEARNLQIVFPSAALGGTSAKRNIIPHTVWNAAASPDALNDEKFIRMIVDQLTEEGLVDSSRIYSTGQSMGSAFGQRLLLCMPDIFAAAGLTSGVFRGGVFGDYDTPGVIEGVQRPIWIIMGENDKGGGSLEVNADAKKNIEYWTIRNKTQPADDPLTFRSGAYFTNVYLNDKGVPMVQFSTVDNKTHACIAQDCWRMYDEFLCRFSMDEKGHTVYMNKIVME